MKKYVLFAVLMAGFVLIFSSCQQTAVTSAKVYMQQQNYDMAIEQAKMAVETVPTDPEAWYVLGQAYGMKRMVREMNDAFTSSLKQSPKFSEQIEQERLKHWIDSFNSGVSLIKQGDSKGSIEKFKLAIELMPDRVDGHKNLAYSYTHANNDSMAIETYKSAIQVAPDDLELKSFLGLLYYKTKKFDKAVEVLQEVVTKADPSTQEYSEALYNMAYSYDLMGQSDKAIQAYETALKVSPNDKDLIFNMGRLYFMQENYEKAVENFKRVVELSPDDADSYTNLGQSYLLLKQYQEAIPHFVKATELSPDNA